MADDELAGVIAGPRDEGPGGTRTPDARAPPPGNRADGLLWFGAELGADGSQVLRITAAAVGRMGEKDAPRPGRPPHRHPLAWLTPGRAGLA